MDINPFNTPISETALSQLFGTPISEITLDQLFSALGHIAVLALQVMGAVIIIKYIIKYIAIFIAASRQQKIQIVFAAMTFAITIVLVFALQNTTTNAMQDLMHQLDEMSTHQEETVHENTFE